MAGTKPKSKLAYLSYDQIQPKIDAGLLDEYDLIFDKNSHEMLILDKDKNIVPVKSKIDSYQSVSDAETALNAKTDTYVGQIVNILTDGEYIPYSVNLDSSAGSYYVTRVGINDYNDLINKPIINIIADNEVVLTDLDDGFYTLIGNYRICDLDTTHRMAAAQKYFVIESLLDDNNNTITHITEISGSRVFKYICSDTEFVEDRYILASEIEGNVDEVLDREFDDRADNYVANHQATNQEIIDLFSN